LLDASGVSSSVEATSIARLWALEIATFNLLGSNKKLRPLGELMALLEAMEIITIGASLPWNLSTVPILKVEPKLSESKRT
jgi:hypothetical protein